MIAAFLLRKQLFLVGSVITGFTGAATHPTLASTLLGFFL